MHPAIYHGHCRDARISVRLPIQPLLHSSNPTATPAASCAASHLRVQHVPQRPRLALWQRLPDARNHFQPRVQRHAALGRHLLVALVRCGGRQVGRGSDARCHGDQALGRWARCVGRSGSAWDRRRLTDDPAPLRVPDDDPGDARIPEHVGRHLPRERPLAAGAAAGRGRRGCFMSMASSVNHNSWHEWWSTCTKRSIGEQEGRRGPHTSFVLRPRTASRACALPGPGTRMAARTRPPRQLRAATAMPVSTVPGLSWGHCTSCTAVSPPGMLPALSSRISEASDSLFPLHFQFPPTKKRAFDA